MAIANPLQPFLWGAGGEQMTPQQVARQREIAAALMGSVGDTSPVDHWLQGVPRLTNALGFSMRENLANEQEASGRKAFQERFNSIFGGGNPVAAALAGGSGGTALDAVNRTASVPSGERASYIRQGLLSRGLPEHVADAFLLNFQDESGLNPAINEAQPLVPGSRGGFGLYQLTGPRRTAYEAFAAERGVDPSDIDAQLDWLMYELQGPEARAAESILGAPDMNSAAVAIVNDFLRPAPEHRQSRASAYMEAQPRTQVASLEPGAGMEVVGNATGDVSDNTVPWSQPGSVIDPTTLIDIPGITDTQGGGDALGYAHIPGVTDQDRMITPEEAEAAGIPDFSGYQTPPTEGTGEVATWLAPDGSARSAERLATNGGPAQYRSTVAQAPQYNIGELIGLANDPWADDVSRSIAMSLVEQQLTPPAPLEPIEVGGVLLDPVTYEPLFDSRTPEPPGFDTVTLQLPDGTQRTFNTAIPEQAEAANALLSQGAIEASSPLVSIGGEGSPGLGNLSTDYGYVLDPDTGQPVIDPETGLPRAAPVPGSPAALAAAQAAAEEEARAGSQAVSDAQSASNTLSDIRSVRETIQTADTPVTGTLSVPFAQFSGTPAGRVRSYVNTLQSGVALGAMQRLKEASATGATGFGALSAPELNLLINEIGALNPDSTEPDIFLETLQRIETNARFVVEDIKRNVSPERIQELGLQPFIDAFEEEGTGTDTPNQSQANPDVVDWSDYFNQ